MGDCWPIVTRQGNFHFSHKLFFINMLSQDSFKSSQLGWSSSGPRVSDFCSSLMATALRKSCGKRSSITPPSKIEDNWTMCLPAKTFWRTPNPSSAMGAFLRGENKMNSKINIGLQILDSTLSNFTYQTWPSLAYLCLILKYCRAQNYSCRFLSNTYSHER